MNPEGNHIEGRGVSRKFDHLHAKIIFTYDNGLKTFGGFGD